MNRWLRIFDYVAHPLRCDQSRVCDGYAEERFECSHCSTSAYGKLCVLWSERRRVDGG
jgi:hypothetical protein